MAATVPPPRRLRFDAFEVDLDSGDLWKDGARLRLQGQPFQVLRLLLERPGEIVTREELRLKLWPKAFVDFDDGVNTAVRKIRDALDDSADEPRYVETLPRRGYRFIGRVQASSSATPRRTRSWWPAAAGAIAAAGIAVWIYRGGGATPPVRAIAVLPLANLSGDASQEYFAAGVTDALTTELARAVGGSLRVTSAGSAAKYRDEPLQKVARELDVDAVVQGSVARAGDHIRVTARLVDARRDRHLWAASYDREAQDVLAVQREIAATIAARVEAKLDPRARTRVASAPVVDPRTYDLYQRGRYRAFSNNPQELAAATGFLEQALASDPNLAPAHAMLARVYVTRSFLEQPGQRDLDARALQEVSRALALDPDLAEAYLARGLVSWTHRNGFPHERAIADIKRALELDPNSAEAHHWLGTIYNHVGLLERGREELETASRLDPANIGIRYRIASSLLIEGRPADALPGLAAARAFFPSNATYGMAWALYELDRKEEAASLIDRYLAENPLDEGGVGNAMRALLHAASGNSSRAEKSIEAAISSGEGFGHFHHAAFTIGETYAVMKRPRDAVRWLRNAADDGFPCYPRFERDRNLDNIRDDAGFVELMKDLKARWGRYKSAG